MDKTIDPWLEFSITTRLQVGIVILWKPSFFPLATVTDVENPLMHFSFYLSLLALILIMLIVHYAFAL